MTDLDENREGRLGPTQREDFERTMRRYMRRTLWWTLPWPLLALAPAIWLLVDRGDGALFLLPILVVFPVGVLLGFAVPRARAALADIAVGRVQEVTGPIERMMINTRSGSARARIGAVALEFYGSGADRGWQDVRDQFRRAWRDGKPVHAYYLPRSRVAVGLTRSSE